MSPACRVAGRVSLGRRVYFFLASTHVNPNLNLKGANKQRQPQPVTAMVQAVGWYSVQFSLKRSDHAMAPREI